MIATGFTLNVSITLLAKGTGLVSGFNNGFDEVCCRCLSGLSDGWLIKNS